ncbi:hypothetical protein [Pontibacter cellulosilyticus]|uniref:Uncharacterized protein n=1 Tax=Pontibacter cellulosilyticus TaxID=1720253 RepID=A0A923N8Z3_9BACT|nr:hypothetical protein [Pontibacter cellulosilyticus]MBC5995100.1 hypothetical protein [Pontibacter cellulosilyticus]
MEEENNYNYTDDDDDFVEWNEDDCSYMSVPARARYEQQKFLDDLKKSQVTAEILDNARHAFLMALAGAGRFKEWESYTIRPDKSYLAIDREKAMRDIFPLLKPKDQELVLRAEKLIKEDEAERRRRGY